LEKGGFRGISEAYKIPPDPPLEKGGIVGADPYVGPGPGADTWVRPYRTNRWHRLSSLCPTPAAKKGQASWKNLIIISSCA
jgi:hypothetical protein